MQKRVVIVGAGHAAGQTAASLREEGFEGEILVTGEESFIPYQRPPLSKKFLAGAVDIERIYFRPRHFYTRIRADLRLDTRVVAINPKEHTVELSGGEHLSYSKLVLTTGSRARKLSVPGAELKGVFYLRTIADVEQIRPCFLPGKKMVIVGGGYIGLEVAAVAAQHGIEVTVLETADRVMARVVDPVVSRFYERIHRQEGVRILTGTALAAFEGENGTLTRVKPSQGDPVDADLAVTGVGIIPNVELARDAGLAVDNGILVDEFCQTSDPDILAAGDCTCHPNPLLGKHLRLESVHNALEQAKTAAATVCGKQKPYAQIPWFWSDQYDLKLQIAGLSQGYDEAVIRGTPEEGRSFAVFYLKAGRLIAVDAINRAPEFMMSRQLIARKAEIPGERLRDESLSMKEVANPAV